MIKYGSQVAFLSEGVIRFGVISEIVTRSGKEDTTEYVVKTFNDLSGEVLEVTLKAEEEIADLESWNKSDALLSLARSSGLYAWAEAESEKILNPPEPTPAPAPPSLVQLNKAESTIPF